jgi:hypothetical protein
MAAGGTQSVGLYCDTAAGECNNICSPARFDLPYDVEVRTGPVSFTGLDDSGGLVFYAASEGSGTIAFIDPDDKSVYAEVAVRAAALDRLMLTRHLTEREPADLDVVLATERFGPHFDVALFSANSEALVDSSLAMQLPPGAQPAGAAIDLFGVASGFYTLEFQAGGKTFSEALEIANEADTIELWEAPATIPRYPIQPGGLEYVCFMAKNLGRYVTGLRWQHTVDGVPASIEYTLGCVLAATQLPSGSLVTFTASAGGRSLTIQIPAR